MFTSTEKKYLALTLAFLAAGSGIKVLRHFHDAVQIGPVEDRRILAADSAQAAAIPDSLAQPISGQAPDSISDLATSSPEPRVRNSSSEVIPVEQSSHFAAPHPGSGSVHPHSGSGRKAAFTGKVSLNHAAPGELMAIRGIGEKTAEVIVQYRTEHGPFRELRELLQVKGIGEKKLEKIVPFLIL